jgi:carbon storage regulator
MLVLSRKPGEKVTIGNAITLTVLDVTGNKVRVGIEAPDHIRILRAELGGWQHDSMGRNEHLDPDLVANPQLVRIAGHRFRSECVPQASRIPTMS